MAEAGEAGIGYETYALMQSLRNECIVGKHQLLHTRRTLTALITHHDDVARNDLAGHDGIVRLGVVVEALRLTTEYTHLLRNAGRTDDRTVRSQISTKDLKARKVIQRVVQAADQIRALHLRDTRQ